MQTSDTAAIKKEQLLRTCYAGMGSRSMGASILRKKMKAANLEIEVANLGINHLTNDAHIIIHKDLIDREIGKIY